MADVVPFHGLRFDESVYRDLTHCRAVIQSSVGYDRIDVPAATARGIMIANLPDYCIEEVSDHAVALVLVRQEHAVLPQGHARRHLRVRHFGRV